MKTVSGAVQVASDGNSIGPIQSKSSGRGGVVQCDRSAEVAERKEIAVAGDGAIRIV
jgi:hypothetical protein